MGQISIIPSNTSAIFQHSAFSIQHCPRHTEGVAADHPFVLAGKPAQS
jgi:hypothetical protein